jgi:hypothetical protein
MAVPHQLLPRQWLLPKLLSRDRVAAQIATFVAALDAGRPYRVTVEEAKSTRTSQQNRYLWGVAYKLIADAVGYEVDEVAEFMCGQYFGWTDKRVPKKPSNPEGVESVPVRTTTTNENGERSVLNKQDFTDYIAFVHRFAASKEIYIPDADEEVRTKW